MVIYIRFYDDDTYSYFNRKIQKAYVCILPSLVDMNSKHKSHCPYLQMNKEVVEKGHY